jgi:hypothetical protein
MGKVLAACCLSLLAAAQPAAAEWQFTPFLGLTFRGNTTLVDLEHATGNVHPAFGGAVSLLGSGIVGAEGLLTITPHFFQSSGDFVESSRLTELMGNVVLTVPRRWTEYFLRPFVSAGFGVVRVSKTDQQDVLPIHTHFASFDIGGGAVGFLSQRTGVRFDVRYHTTVHGTEAAPGVANGDAHLRYLTAAIGVVIRR